jgi:hypothetical protein
MTALKRSEGPHRVAKGQLVSSLGLTVAAGQLRSQDELKYRPESCRSHIVCFSGFSL